jgi:hypothetical protein
LFVCRFLSAFPGEIPSVYHQNFLSWTLLRIFRWQPSVVAGKPSHCQLFSSGPWKNTAAGTSGQLGWRKRQLRAPTWSSSSLQPVASSGLTGLNLIAQPAISACSLLHRKTARHTEQNRNQITIWFQTRPTRLPGQNSHLNKGQSCLKTTNQ